MPGPASLARARRRRGGATAIEFALLLPLLVAIVTSTMDYGWYFLQESLVLSALRDAVRAGSYQNPAAGEASNACAACLSLTASVAVAELADLGIAASEAEVTPTVANVAGTCALVLEPTVPHAPLIGFVPMPATYALRVVAYAQNLSGC